MPYKMGIQLDTSPAGANENDVHVTVHVVKVLEKDVTVPAQGAVKLYKDNNPTSFFTAELDSDGFARTKFAEGLRKDPRAIKIQVVFKTKDEQIIQGYERITLPPLKSETARQEWKAAGFKVRLSAQRETVAENSYRFFLTAEIKTLERKGDTTRESEGRGLSVNFFHNGNNINSAPITTDINGQAFCESDIINAADAEKRAMLSCKVIEGERILTVSNTAVEKIPAAVKKQPDPPAPHNNDDLQIFPSLDPDDDDFTITVSTRTNHKMKKRSFQVISPKPLSLSVLGEDTARPTGLVFNLETKEDGSVTLFAGFDGPQATIKFVLDNGLTAEATLVK